MVQTSAFSGERLGRMNAVLRGPVERREVAGIVALVARRDSVHVEMLGVQDFDSRRPMRRDTIFRVASMTKPITAAAMMILVEEARIRLDDPVEPWLPELADRRVLRSIDSPLDETVPAGRRVTLRDVLTFRLGLGVVMAQSDSYPIQAAMSELGVAPSADPIAFAPEEYMARIGRLPLIHQPGDVWMYHIGAEILGVLIARVAGMPLGDFLRERIFEPLGMGDTGFSVPESSIDRLATCYVRDDRHGLKVWDTGRGGHYAQAPIFPSELVSTADDYLAFARMLLNQGRSPGGRILSRPSVELMMTDQITAEQKAASPFFPGFWDNKGWGLGAAITTRRDGVAASPGSYGWSGGFGTSFIADRSEDLVAIFLLQRVMNGPEDAGINQDFFTLAYQAIDD